MMRPTLQTNLKRRIAMLAAAMVASAAVIASAWSAPAGVKLDMPAPPKPRQVQPVQPAVVSTSSATTTVSHAPAVTSSSSSSSIDVGDLALQRYTKARGGTSETYEPTPRYPYGNYYNTSYWNWPWGWNVGWSAGWSGVGIGWVGRPPCNNSCKPCKPCTPAPAAK